MILALAVVIAVIIFGALISVGNERQRKSIDDLREQIVLWAIQDLRIKREKLARGVYVENPLGWLNGVVERSCGNNLNLQLIEAFENPEVLICATEGGNSKAIFTPLSPAEILAMKRTRRNRLSRYADRNPLLSLPRGVTVYECSVLNTGILFDLELPLAWKGLTGNSIGERGTMWIYMLS